MSSIDNYRVGVEVGTCFPLQTSLHAGGTLLNHLLNPIIHCVVNGLVVKHTVKADRQTRLCLLPPPPQSRETLQLMNCWQPPRWLNHVLNPRVGSTISIRALPEPTHCIPHRHVHPTSVTPTSVLTSAHLLPNLLNLTFTSPQTPAQTRPC
jgi:hypothetical protein